MVQHNVCLLNETISIPVYSAEYGTEDFDGTIMLSELTIYKINNIFDIFGRKMPHTPTSLLPLTHVVV